MGRRKQPPPVTVDIPTTGLRIESANEQGNYVFQGFVGDRPAKRAKTNKPSEEIGAGMSTGAKGKKSQATPGQKQSEVTTEFLHNLAKKYYNIICSHYAYPGVDGSATLCIGCHKQQGKYRCTECYHASLLCGTCIAVSHQPNPLHVVEKWTGSFYEKVTLADIGLVINLGHEGAICPSKWVKEPSKLVCVHISGIQEIRIRYCECFRRELLDKSENHLQLVQAGLWPATVAQPSTVLTFAVLRSFHKLTVTSKITAYDFAAFLQRMTNNAAQKRVPERYKELLRAARSFDFLQTCRWFGQEPDVELEAGCLAIKCPSCPWVDLNMDPGWKQRPQEEQYLDALSYAKDGNYAQGLHDKLMDKDDRAYTQGAGSFADPREFNKWLAKYKEHPKQSKNALTSTCSTFKAMHNQYKGKLISGLLAMICAREGILFPNGLVNVFVGETWFIVDFATWQVVCRFLLIAIHYGWYDIACQYAIYFLERMKNFAGNRRLPTTYHLIGSFHLPAHKLKQCHTIHNGKRVHGCAHTDGETCERCWAAQNALGRSTREMTPGHREDTINVHMSDYNIQKVFDMPATHEKRLKQAKIDLKEEEWCLKDMEEDLQQYNAPLEEWKERERKWLAKASDPSWLRKNIDNPYEPTQGSAPTQKQALAALNREVDQERAATGSRPAQMRVRLIEWTLDIEQKQLQITSLVTEYKKDEANDKLINTIESERQGLLNDLFAWEDLFEEVAGPTIARIEKKQAFANIERVLLPSQLNVQPEAILLPIPSRFPPEIRDSPELKGLRAAELKLREGRLHDLLEEIRTRVTLQSLLYRSSKKHSVGQAGKTRTGHALEASREAVRALRDEYNYMRPLAITLGADGEHNFQVLLENDCRAPVLEHGQKARSRKEKEKDGENVTWLFRLGAYRSSSAPEEVEKYMIELKRVTWFQQRAAVARAKEQVQLTRAEMRRAQRTFRAWHRDWAKRAEPSCAGSDTDGRATGLGKAADARMLLGKASYAAKQARMWKELFDKCHALYPADVHVTFDGSD